MLLTLATRCIELLEKTALCQGGNVEVREIVVWHRKNRRVFFRCIYIFVKSNCEIEKCNEINYINDIILVSKTILYILYLSKQNYLKVI